MFCEIPIVQNAATVLVDEYIPHANVAMNIPTLFVCLLSTYIEPKVIRLECVNTERNEPFTNKCVEHDLHEVL